mgnify:CR=1 FL=1
MDKGTTTHIAALSAAGQEVLQDSRLVEDYSDVMARRPAPHDEQSVSGSVVVTSANAAGHTNGTTATPGSDMDYSDSEFEDNLEQRLMDLGTASDNTSNNTVEGAKDTIKHRPSSDQLRLGQPALEFSDDDDEDHGLFASENEVDEEEDDEDDEDDDDDDDDDEEYDEFTPLQPPQELDPDKLYALYAFNGPDTSHCQLEQDEACVLLNDQDAYWWLVKRCRDNKIGFAPAEILETFPERLARLNCWKNEDLSASKVKENENENGNDNNNDDDDEEEVTAPLAQYKKNGSKSVSFNDIVTYADRYIAEEKDDDDSDSPDRTSNESLHHDEYGNEALHYNDEASDTVSDVSFSTGYTQPLVYKKTRGASPPEENTDNITNDIEGLLNPATREPLMAPSAPFSGRRTSTTGGSDLSISTIGEFSPSTASEQTQGSPTDASPKSPAQPLSLPASRAMQDISTLVQGSSDTSLSLSISLGEDSDASDLGEHCVVPKDTPHPKIASIYSPFFAQIDTLLGSLDALLATPQ